MKFLSPFSPVLRGWGVGLLLWGWIGMVFPAAGQTVVDATSLSNKILTGYQGWFTAPGTGYSTRWIHWTRDHVTPTGASNNLIVEMYPDLREFDPDELIATGMTRGGATAHLYAARHPKTVRRHVRWMMEYGIDGAFLQRFVRTHYDGDTDYKAQMNAVLWNFRSSCADYGRVFAVMYDVSGMLETEGWDTLIQDDWKSLVDAGLTSGGRYLHHQGRPLVAIWGPGFTHCVPADPAKAQALIDWFRSNAPVNYRAAVWGGVPGEWRTKTGDSRTQSGWDNVYRSYDVISPWTVGRFPDEAGADSWKSNRLVPDLASAQTAGRIYAPVVWPGFSWKNLNNGPTNQIPRKGGKFFWRQIGNAKSAGAGLLYLAMFDEVDEATAIYKVAENRSQVPDQGYWLTLDADGTNLPSDWYLRLSYEGGRMIRGEIPLTTNFPATPGSAGASGWQGWAGVLTGQTGDLLRKYAWCGAENPRAAGTEPSVIAETNRLTLTTVVRTNDPRLVVRAEVATNLSDFSLSTNLPVASYSVVADPTNLPAGHEKRVFTLPRDSERKFLRLRATYSP